MDELEGAVAAPLAEPVAEESLESAHSAFAREAAGFFSDETDGAGDAEAGAAPDVESEQPATTTGVPAAAALPAIQVNWDADDNPYKKQAAEHKAAFDGLQPKVQELTEFQKRVLAEQVQAQARERESQLRQFQERLQYLTPEQQAAARLALQGATAQAQANSVMHQQQQLEARRQAEAKVQMTQIIGRQIGVDPAMLMVYETPGQILRAAEMVKAQKAQTATATAEVARKTRAETGADGFIGGGGQPGAGKPAESIEEANALFAKDLSKLTW